VDDEELIWWLRKAAGSYSRVHDEVFEQAGARVGERLALASWSWLSALISWKRSGQGRWALKLMEKTDPCVTSSAAALPGPAEHGSWPDRPGSSPAPPAIHQAGPARRATTPAGRKARPHCREDRHAGAHPTQNTSLFSGLLGGVAESVGSLMLARRFDRAVAA
jgi:hypothetical protein